MPIYRVSLFLQMKCPPSENVCSSLVLLRSSATILLVFYADMLSSDQSLMPNLLGACFWKFKHIWKSSFSPPDLMTDIDERRKASLSTGLLFLFLFCFSLCEASVPTHTFFPRRNNCRYFY
ncbi:hypothetical protein CPC08DRAFT_118708 [Agrocybe pediades]|nr:hypothetical protein CPC08DRAFT_118708 [Agrocybe pediades]